MSGRLNNSNQVVEDSVIINTNVNNIVKNDQDLGLFQLIETLLIENKSLKLQNQSLKEELNGVMGKLEHAEVMKRRLEHVESSLADRERELEARDDQIRESKARGQMADDASDSFKHGVKMIEDNYDSSLRDCLDQIEQHRRQMSLISEKQERRARDVQTSASKNKGDLIAKLTSLTSSLTANDTEGVPTDDVRSIIDEMQRQVAKEYVFDEKIIVDNTVIVDPEVIKLTKKIENLYSSRYEGLPKELRAASHLSGNSDGQSKLLIEDLSGIVIQSENNKRKYVEEMNSLLTEINMSLNNEQDDQLNLESLFPSVIIPNIQEFSIMSPNPQRKFSESQSGFGAGGLISRMKREGRLQDAQGLASINPSGKDLDPSYSDVQPSPLLPTKGVKSIAANRFGDHRRIRVPDSENESEDASSRLLPVESIPIIGGSPHGIRGAKPMLLTGKRSSTRGDLSTINLIHR